MTPAYEKRLLHYILLPVTAAPRTSLVRREVVPMLQGLAVMLLYLALFRFTDSIGYFGVVLIASCLGFVAGVFFYRRVTKTTATSDWAIIAPHVSSESVLARLAQLEQGST